MSKNNTTEAPSVAASGRRDLQNPLLKESVKPADSKLKELIVDYIGNKLDPEDGNVTIEMTLQVFADEFEEFVLPLAEENWIRGYEQALLDVENGKTLMEESVKKSESNKGKKRVKQKQKS